MVVAFIQPVFWRTVNKYYFRKKNVKEIYNRKYFGMCFMRICAYLFILHVSIHMCMDACEHTFAHMCIWKPVVDVSWNFPQFSQYALRQASNELDNLASLLWKLQSLTHEYLNDKGLHCLPGFYVNSGDLDWGPHKVYTFCKAQKVLYLPSHHSSPYHRFYDS